MFEDCLDQTATGAEGCRCKGSIGFDTDCHNKIRLIVESGNEALCENVESIQFYKDPNYEGPEEDEY